MWLSARRAWRIELDKGLTVELGRDNADVRLARFIDAYPRTIAAMGDSVQYVDLRYPNGFAVRLPPGTVIKPVKTT
jgi:cell division protein FtsQ